MEMAKVGLGDGGEGCVQARLQGPGEYDLLT